MKKKLYLSGAVLLTALLFFNCSIEQTYEMGDTGPSGAGVVFFITDGGLHGFEAAPADLNSPYQWSSVENAFVNGLTALPTGRGSGSANTDAIIGQSGHTYSAAQVCRDYAGGGFTDWFLPSRDELFLLFNEKAVVGGFSDATYWSSSETSTDLSCSLNFVNGNQTIGSKGSTQRIRAIRAF